MKKFLCLIGGAMLMLSGQAQNKEVKPFFIGDRVPDLPLNRMANYKDSSTLLSKFADKLIILDFWSLRCSSCIGLFERNDSLQKANPEKIEFILVTLDPLEKVDTFLNKYKQQHQDFSLPIICSANTISSLFRHHGVPHYVLISPNGNIILQSSGSVISPRMIMTIAAGAIKKQNFRKKNHFPNDMIHLPKPPKILLEAIQQNKYISL